MHINLQPGSFQSIGIWSEDEQVQHYVDKGYGDKQTIEQFIEVLNGGAKDARAFIQEKIMLPLPIVVILKMRLVDKGMTS